jgi:hydrogenase expression/formation protein HypD
VSHAEQEPEGIALRSLAARIRTTATRPWAVMEVSGGPLRALVTRQLTELVAPTVDVLGGGCPICLMPAEQLENARRLAATSNLVFVTLHNVLGTSSVVCESHAAAFPPHGSQAASSPIEALDIAVAHADREVVFFAAGTELSAPANAMAVWRAHQLGLRNFSVLVSHATAPMAIAAALKAPGNRAQAFLAAGHLGGIMGWGDYEPIAATYRVPVVVTGLEAVDILEGIYLAVRQLEEGRYDVEHQDVRSVRRDGTPPARDIVAKVFQVIDRHERHPERPLRLSGLALRAEFADYDAEQRFGLARLPG